MKHAFSGVDVKGMAVILAVELGMFFLTVYKGVGSHSLPVAAIMMVFTLGTYVLASLFQADKPLLLIVLVLLNLGFVVQLIQAGDSFRLHSFIMKLMLAITSALVVSVFYYWVDKWMGEDLVTLLLMLVQLMVSAVMVGMRLFAGRMEEGQAMISLGGITPFELVKVLYLFAAAALLCREGAKSITVFGKKMNREFLLCLHTCMLCVCLVLCSELGTMMIVYFTGLILLWIFGKSRKKIFRLTVISLIGFALVWILCTMLLLPFIQSHPGALPGMVTKIVKRFGTVPHPERYMKDYGYQATLGLEAISLGGWLGLDTERYRLALPEASNDYIFANIVQTCGFIMGVFLILFLFAFLKRGMTIADRCENTYIRGMATGITVLILVEAIIHIGYNLAVFPVTGIPLYFLSQGFTAIVTGMALIAMLLVISAKNAGKEVR